MLKNIIVQSHSNCTSLKGKSTEKGVFLLLSKSNSGFNTFIVPLSCPKAANLRSSLKQQQEMGASGAAVCIITLSVFPFISCKIRS